VQVTSARFHQFDLARQLERRGLLAALFTGYPRWKLQQEGLPPAKLHTFPWLHVPWMAGGARLLRRVGWDDAFHAWSLGVLDRHVERSLPAHTDVLIAMSGHGLRCGRLAQERGGAWVCVRGSTHIRHQDAVLRAEYRRWGFASGGRSARAIAREESEYAGADRIAVPSRQVLKTFLAHGVPAERMALVPYGVDLTRFFPEGAPDADEFQIVFAGALSVRKGVGHLLNAFARLRHPRKRLLLVGSAGPETRQLLRDAPAGVEVIGHQPQAKLREIFSRSHVMALGSVEEGLANVLGQALACGCPVVATEATGAADLFTDGVEGFIVPEADPAMIAEKLERLAQEPDLRQRMAEAALRRVREIGGWDRYGDLMENLIRTLVAERKGT